MKEKHTKELLNILKDTSSEKSLKEVISREENNFTDSSFSKYFMELTCDYGTDRSEIVKASRLDRTYAYQILNGTKNPKKDKVVALCLAAHINLDCTQRCLTLSNNSILYAKNRRDAILIYAIENSLSVQDTNSILMDLDENILE